MKQRILKTALHLIELSGVLFVAWFITTILKIELPVEIFALIIAAAAKFARTGDRDWVNK